MHVSVHQVYRIMRIVGVYAELHFCTPSWQGCHLSPKTKGETAILFYLFSFYYLYLFGQPIWMPLTNSKP